MAIGRPIADQCLGFMSVNGPGPVAVLCGLDVCVERWRGRDACLVVHCMMDGVWGHVIMRAMEG